MKKLLIGLIALTSIAAHAEIYCKAELIDVDTKESKITAFVSQVTKKKVAVALMGEIDDLTVNRLNNREFQGMKFNQYISFLGKTEINLSQVEEITGYYLSTGNMKFPFLDLLYLKNSDGSQIELLVSRLNNVYGICTKD